MPQRQAEFVCLLLGDGQAHGLPLPGRLVIGVVGLGMWAYLVFGTGRWAEPLQLSTTVV
jgi:hypothetical protein